MLIYGTAQNVSAKHYIGKVFVLSANGERRDDEID